MLAAITSGLALVLKLLGFADVAEKLYEKVQAQKTGMQLQAGADAEASVKEAQKAGAVADKVAAETDAQLDSDLRADARK